MYQPVQCDKIYPKGGGRSRPKHFKQFRSEKFECELVLNIVDLDSTIRAMANRGHFSREAILALWDFLAAFPSIRHKWILAVFKAYKFPTGFLRFLEFLGFLRGSFVFLA